MSGNIKGTYITCDCKWCGALYRLSPIAYMVAEVGSIPVCCVGSRKSIYDRVEGEAEVDMVKWVDWLCTQMRRLSKSLQEREASGWRINLIMGDAMPTCMNLFSHHVWRLS